MCIRDSISVLASCGGLEIAALTGVFLGGAGYKVPVAVSYTHLM